MTRKLADVHVSPVRTSAQGGLVLMHAAVVMGAAVIASQTTDTVGLTVTRAGAGDFDIVFPACAKVWNVHVMLDNVGTPVDLYAQLRSVDATAGTASFDTLAVATPTDPANTTKIYITIEGVALSVE